MREELGALGKAFLWEAVRRGTRASRLELVPPCPLARNTLGGMSQGQDGSPCLTLGQSAFWDEMTLIPVLALALTNDGVL